MPDTDSRAGRDSGRAPRPGAGVRRAGAVAAGVGVLLAGAAVPASAAGTAAKVPAGSYAARLAATRGHGLGLLTSSTVVRPAQGMLRAASALAAPAVLPDSVDLSPWAAPVGNQGQVSSCVAWAIDYGMLGWYANRTGHTGAPYAPMYAYSQMQAKYGWHDQGAYASDAYQIAADQGIDAQSDYPQGLYDWQTLPTAAQKTHAAANRTTGFTTLYQGTPGTAARTAISTALASQHPVALGISVYGSFFSLSSSRSVMRAADVSGGSYGGHEVLAVGYDATGVRIENSWGTGWGDRGFGTLSWDFLASYSHEATVMTGFVGAPTPTPTPPAPVVTAASPARVTASGGTTVTLTGTGLTGATSVTVAGRPATGVRVLSDRSLTLVTPAVPAGAAPVVVTGPGGASAPVTFTAVAPPVAGALTPATGAVTGGVTVRLTGSGLTGATAVTFRGRPGTGLRVLSDTSLSVVVPAGTAGPAPVVVTTPYGTASAGTFAYTPVPAVTALSPTSGPAAGGTVVVLRGSGFTGATGVTVDGRAATGVTVLSDTSLQFVTPAGRTGLLGVQVLGVNGARSVVLKGFTARR